MELPTLFMGVIAAAVLAIAVAQVVTLWYGLRIVQRLNQIADRVENDIQPAIDRVNAVSSDMTRATALVLAQLERADQLFARFAGRAERLMALGQDAVSEPVRRGKALIHALLAALDTLRAAPRRGSAKAAADDEQEALFIG